jgi:hypothetical protein
MRPYFHHAADDLERTAYEKWDDLDVLLDVTVELFHRRTMRARTLRAELIERLGELIQEGFDWPSTDAPGGSGRLEVESPTKGLLSFLGYRVGRNGLSEQERRAILDAVYCEELPPVDSSEYMAEWGRPRTGPRLQKLAESIAALTRNAKRRRGTDLSTAVDEWEADLQYLRAEHYLGRYDFAWPTT